MKVVLLVGLLSALLNGGFAGEFNRVNDEKCDGCVISQGVGYNSFENPEPVDVPDCTCYYHCTLDIESYSFVAFKMCCPCGQAWSMVLMTCVHAKHAKSDCRQRADLNPCDGKVDGELVERYDPFRTGSYARPMCRSYYRCTDVPGSDDVVPIAECLEDDFFDPDTDSITEIAPDHCTLADLKAEGDCCPEPESSEEQPCPLISWDDGAGFLDPRMGDMSPIACPPGTEFDDDRCACIRSQNYVLQDACPKKFVEDFENPGGPITVNNYGSAWPSVTGSPHFLTVP